jgi:hypothetical protein
MKIVPTVGIVILLSVYVGLLSDLILAANKYPEVEKSESMGYLKWVFVESSGGFWARWLRKLCMAWVFCITAWLGIWHP